MCTCKILRFIARTILGILAASVAALAIGALVILVSITTAQDFIMLSTALVAVIILSGIVIWLVHLAAKRCDGDR